jgi:hypothetical protein
MLMSYSQCLGKLVTNIQLSELSRSLRFLHSDMTRQRSKRDLTIFYQAVGCAASLVPQSSDSVGDLA